MGPGYPSTARVVEDAGEVLAEFESRLDRSDPALVDWEPTRVALGYTPALESLTDYSVLENRFALVIRLTEQATRRIKARSRITIRSWTRTVNWSGSGARVPRTGR